MAKVRHLVINAFSARRGGGKTYLFNFLNYFPVGQRLKVTILVSKNFEIETMPDWVNIKIVAFPVDNPLFRSVWEALVLPLYLRRERVDIFFCPGGTIPFSVRSGPWKTVTMFRNMIPFDLRQRNKYPFGYMRLRNWLLSKVMLSSMESADAVIFISSYARGLIEARSKKGIKKAITIPHGVGDDFRNVGKASEARPSYFPKQSYIVYPSIIDVYKSQKEVVKAVAILRNQGIRMPLVLLTGEVYGSYGEEVRFLIKSLGLQQQVVIFGAVKYEHMPLLYYFADFVIFASQSENCPNILLEALASSNAIICSNKMPMPEFAGDAVEYFDPDDFSELSEKIKKLLDQSQVVNELKIRAAQRAENYHCSDSAFKTWRFICD
jgi:glycosyltransferase involved in cell wall biosynthesis